MSLSSFSPSQFLTSRCHRYCDQLVPYLTPSPGGAPTRARGAAAAAPPWVGGGLGVSLLLLFIFSKCVKFGNFFSLHHRSAEEGNTNHEGPAGNDAKPPQEVADGHCKVVLCELAIKGMEVTLIRRLLLP